ncbi:MAG: hypothetical protein MUC69_09770 [Gemmatimonadales bacterium]|jgi:hypothetical protein|nr:hypothetical protein [Gemmatimonadales bacterium]
MSSPTGTTARSALTRATAIGTVAQLAMVLVGHRNAEVAGMFALLGTSISGVAGFLVPFLAKGLRMPEAARYGTVAGGVAAVLGILVSFALGDVPLGTVALGGGMSAVAGAIGGVIAQRLGARTS